MLKGQAVCRKRAAGNPVGREIHLGHIEPVWLRPVEEVDLRMSSEWVRSPVHRRFDVWRRSIPHKGLILCANKS